jgi:hypothetical protein
MTRLQGKIAEASSGALRRPDFDVIEGKEVIIAFT